MKAIGEKLSWTLFMRRGYRRASLIPCRTEVWMNGLGLWVRLEFVYGHPDAAMRHLEGDEA